MQTIIRPIYVLTMACLMAGCEAGVGDKCSTSNDCPTGTVCDTDSPGGYCLASGCEFNDECPENSVCVSFTKNQSYCLKKCKKSGDCRSGYACRDDIGTQPFCYVKSDHAYGRDATQEVDFALSPRDDEETADADQTP